MLDYKSLLFKHPIQDAIRTSISDLTHDYELLSSQNHTKYDKCINYRTFLRYENQPKLFKNYMLNSEKPVRHNF